MKRTPLKRTGRLKPRSQKQERRMALVKRDYADVFATNPKCALCETRPGVEPHHSSCKRRAGDGVFFWHPFCSVCHHGVHNVPSVMQFARAKGLLNSRWEERYERLHPILFERNLMRGL